MLRFEARFPAVSVATDNKLEASPLTLGDLLYADPAAAWVPEKEWLALIRAIAAGEEAALHVLFEKTRPILFTYVMRLTCDRALTEQVLLDVFEDIWCEAPVFDVDQGPVLGWVMRRARSMALTLGQGGKKTTPAGATNSADVLSIGPVGEGARRAIESFPIERALATLSVQEREAIEAALIDGFSYVELAAHSGESVATVKGRLRTGLAKLQRALRDRGEEA